ncbi:hypothetical protein MRX96_043615 [Rhipicephalus microplus]
MHRHLRDTAPTPLQLSALGRVRANAERVAVTFGVCLIYMLRHGFSGFYHRISSNGCYRHQRISSGCGRWFLVHCYPPTQAKDRNELRTEPLPAKNQVTPTAATPTCG